MTLYALLFTLTALGISETAYLIGTRRQQKMPRCIFGTSCHIVLQSKYRTTFGIYNDVLGLCFYGVLAILIALLILSATFIDVWIVATKILLVIGSVMSVYFTYLQWRYLTVWCFWCLVSAVTIWFMTFILFVVT